MGKKMVLSVLVLTSVFGVVSSHACAEQEGSLATKAKKVKPVATNKLGSSGETTAERVARLKRECKGLPNAGACLGYVH